MNNKITILKTKGLLKLIGEESMNYSLLEKNNEKKVDLTNIFNNNLQDYIHITIKKDNKELFVGQGMLQYQKVNGRLWKLYVGDKCVDDILWDNVAEHIGISIIKVGDGTC